MSDLQYQEKQPRLRSLAQNRALHKFFELLAESLNDAGLDMRVVLKPEVDIPWSKNTIKEFLWRPIQNAQLGKISTIQLNTKDIDIIYDTLNRFLSEKWGLSVPFPSVEEIMLDKTYGKRKL